MPDLNPRQQEAVSYLDGPLLVLAGAGSGKTRVITKKIVHLIEKAGISAAHIAAVTFTNKAAREMKNRVKNECRNTKVDGIKISTFHTLGLNILRKEHQHVGLKSRFTLLDQEDSQGVMKELLKKQKLQEETQNLQWQISSWKNDLVSPEQALAEAQDQRQHDYARQYLAYQEMLQAYNAVDFDDLLRLPVTLFKNCADSLEKWQNRIRYLLVDEYQDTNNAQYELVKQLVGVRQALTVVGDDDQSIYAWRGARPENLVRLKEDFRNLKIIKLEQNYRSTGRILKAANHLIQNNPHVFEKKLWSDLGAGEMLRAINCRDENDEINRVATEVLHHRFNNGCGYGDYAILYRGNYQSRGFEKALRQQNIPYFLSGGQSFFNRAEIKDVMAYLRLIANPDDDTAFLRIINTPHRGIGAGTLQKLAGHANQRNLALKPACDELALAEQIKPHLLEKIRTFSSMIDHYARLIEETDISTCINRLLSEMDYPDWIQEQSSSDKAAERKQENIDELLEWLDRLQKDETRDGSATGLVNHMMLMDVLERQDEEAGEDLSLIHI